MTPQICHVTCIFNFRVIVIELFLTMPVPNLSDLTEKEFSEFLKTFDTVICDCDGVLWLGSCLIPNAQDAINGFRKLGKSIFFVTNNSSKSREEYVNKLNKFGFIASTDEILSASYLVACYLQDIKFKKKAYIVGSEGIGKELDSAGIKHLAVGPDPMGSDVQALVDSEALLDDEVGVVIVGSDEHISYPKILKAGTYLDNPSCLFLATSTDARFPMKSALVAPGVGCVVAAIQCCSRRNPLVIGKPSPYIKDFLMTRHKIDPSRTLILGDRGNTDILLGSRCGFQKVLVLTGISKLADIEKWENSDDEEVRGYVPNYYLDKLADIVPKLNVINKEYTF